MELNYYQIDDVAKLTQLTKRTIRYYEDMELIKPERSDSSYRLYSEEDVETIIEIRDLRLKFGLNIVEVKNFLGLRKELNEAMEDPVDSATLKSARDHLMVFIQKLEEREAVLQRVKNKCIQRLEHIDEKIEQTRSAK